MEEEEEKKKSRIGEEKRRKEKNSTRKYVAAIPCEKKQNPWRTSEVAACWGESDSFSCQKKAK